MARALYIHWPFCLSKCPYCDFNSHVRASIDVSAWQDALLADMRHEANIAGGERLTSIFFGGGTPSLMPPALVERLLTEAEQLWGFAPGIEITLEGNPSSVESANYANLASAGINRASLGLQSLNDEALRFLGRLHNVAEGVAAMQVAQQHFRRVSIDLIYARPGQTIEAWENELQQAIGFGTGHMSLYQLTIEDGTRFASMVRNQVFTPLDNDTAADMFALTRTMTANAGLAAYEVSNHARPGEESRHNLAYWRMEDHCGIGPGAHGRRGGIATARHRKPENWLAAIARQGHGIDKERTLSPPEQASEALLMGLRLAEGVNLAKLGEQTGIDSHSLVNHTRFALYEKQGLVWRQGNHIGVSDTGILLLDALIAEIVPDTLVMA